MPPENVNSGAGPRQAGPDEPPRDPQATGRFSWRGFFAAWVGALTGFLFGGAGTRLQSPEVDRWYRDFTDTTAGILLVAGLVLIVSVLFAVVPQVAYSDPSHRPKNYFLAGLLYGSVGWLILLSTAGLELGFNFLKGIGL